MKQKKEIRMKKNQVSKPFKVGDKIKWLWMGRPVKGVVKKIYFKPVTKTFRGTEFKRNASEETPAYLVKSNAGSEVLKSHTELSAQTS
jgi:hypothetical protein